MEGLEILRGSGTWQLWVEDGTYLTGADVGDAHGTLALLHGGASNRLWWALVAGLLRHRYRIVAWDHRGHGESGPCNSRCTIEQLAEDALVVLDAHELRDVVLVGHSLGATVALAAAARDEASRVRSVVCVDGGVFRVARSSGRTVRRRVSHVVLEAWLPAAGLPKAALPAVLGNFRRDGDDLLLRIEPESHEQLLRSLWSQHLSRLVAPVVVPVVVLAADDGDADARAVRRRAIEDARRASAAPIKEEWIVGGHDLPLQDPDAVAAGIDRAAAEAGSVDACLGG